MTIPTMIVKDLETGPIEDTPQEFLDALERELERPQEPLQGLPTVNPSIP